MATLLVIVRRKKNRSEVEYAPSGALEQRSVNVRSPSVLIDPSERLCSKQVTYFPTLRSDREPSNWEEHKFFLGEVESKKANLAGDWLAGWKSRVELKAAAASRDQ
jgi:hypothetical protein